VLAPATLAALPSTRAIETCLLPTSLAATHRGFAFYVAFPQTLHSLTRNVFYVADPISSIETHSLPTFNRSYPRHFTFHVADPISSVRARSFALPSFQRSPIMHHKPLMMRAKSNGNSKFGSARRVALEAPLSTWTSKSVIWNSTTSHHVEAISRWRRIGIVTTALPFKCGKSDTFKSRRVQFFRKEQSKL